ncbi:hypothetical protein G6F35_009088 [Rhizopus arrhizus]|nr:hypothetical protein G6F35_009088 [Rhizopus arrhizus]
MMEGLTTQFADLKISKSSLHEFVTEKCRISLKRAHFHSIERNSPQKIEERYQRVKQWEKTDLDFKRERAVVVTPRTRAKTTTIIEAISLYSVVNIKVKFPKVAAPSKKRKAASGGSAAVGKDVMDKHELFKGHYLVMDNAPIHKHADIRSYIESRGYGCVYLPPYSPELNRIEQFWSVCKSKLKREALLEEETLTSESELLATMC